MDSNASIAASNFNETGIYALPLSIWIIYETCSVVLISVAFYLFLVLLHFAYVKSKKVRRRQQNKAVLKRDSSKSNSKLTRTTSDSSTHGSIKRRKQIRTGQSAGSLRLLCLLAAFFALLRISADQLELATYGRERLNCKIYQVVVVITYALSATCIYSALWLRLRIFFRHPIMKHLASSSVIICLIWMAFFSIIASAIINTIIFLITVRAKDSSFGCILGETVSISPTLRYVILTLSTITSQGILLYLFLYPLLKHRYKIKSFRVKTPVTIANSISIGVSITVPSNRQSPTSNKYIPESPFTRQPSTPMKTWSWRSGNFYQTKKIEREKKLLSIIFRVLITALICVVSDVIAAVATIALNNQPRVVSNMVFNVNLLVNLVSVLFSFGDWQLRLAPCCSKKASFNQSRKKDSRTLYQQDVIGQTENKNHFLKPPDLKFEYNRSFRNSASLSNVSQASKIPSTPIFTASHDDSIFVFE